MTAYLSACNLFMPCINFDDKSEIITFRFQHFHFFLNVMFIEPCLFYLKV